MQKERTEKIKSAPKIGLLSVILACFVVAIFVAGKSNKSCTEAYLSDKTISNGEYTINAELADTPDSRQTGLSGRDCIDDFKGMLFVFDSPDLHGIWMKDMKFPIDIIWLDSNKKIVHIETSVKPDSFPKVFYPSSLSSYVLEVQSGASDRSQIYVGQQLTW